MSNLLFYVSVFPYFHLLDVTGIPFTPPPLHPRPSILCFCVFPSSCLHYLCRLVSSIFVFPYFVLVRWCVLSCVTCFLCFVFGEHCACALSCVTCFLCFVFGEQKMVQRMKEIVSEYEDRLWKMELVPRSSYGRGLRRKDGASNKMFLT